MADLASSYDNGRAATNCWRRIYVSQMKIPIGICHINEILHSRIAEDDLIWGGESEI